MVSEVQNSLLPEEDRVYPWEPQVTSPSVSHHNDQMNMVQGWDLKSCLDIYPFLTGFGGLDIPWMTPSPYNCLFYS